MPPPRPLPPLALVGIPSSRRVAAFQEALARAGQPPATVVSYLDLIEGRAHLRTVLPAGGLVRIDSPGRDHPTECALLALGADPAPESSPLPRPISRRQARSLPFEKGRIWAPRQWFLGFRRLLQQIDLQIAASADHAHPDRQLIPCNAPAEIALCFDKPACHAHLLAHGVTCPPALVEPPIASYQALREQMRAAGWSRVFVKLAHGSSASGIVALAVSVSGIVATTTVEVVPVPGQQQPPRLFNTRALRRLTREADVAALINALAPEGLHVERWLPKAGLDGHTCDLRVVTIAGQATHALVRLAHGPITNLHLGNRRAAPDRLRLQMGPDPWLAALAHCQRTASLFPRSLHLGIDLLVAPDYQRTAVLEVNAFGDFLIGCRSASGHDTYTHQLDAIRAGWPDHPQPSD